MLSIGSAPGGENLVEAIVPLSTMVGYSRDIRALTAGR